MKPRVSAVVVAYGSEPLLMPGVTALLASRDVDIEVVVVDNGCTDDSINAVRSLPGVTVIEPGRNLGFTLGCAVGVDASDRDYLAFVNPDAVAEPDAVAHLVAALQDPSVGISTASIRLADRPDRVNSAGNAAHFLGFSWCIGFDEPASQYSQPRDVACASGAGMAIRRETWRALGGFVPEFFAYFEDSELSLRAWQQGWRVRYVPDAVVTHDYTPNHASPKMYLVERNRLITLLTLYERRTLVRLLGPILATELAVALYAGTQGWGRAKVAGWWWILRHWRWLRERRTAVQTTRTKDDSTFADVLETRITHSNEPLPSIVTRLDSVAAAYWRWAGRPIRSSARVTSSR